MHKWSKYSLTSDTIGLYEEIFEDLFIFDAHAHIGMDKDGSKMSVEALIKAMKESHVISAIIFPLNDPVHYKDFAKPNNVVLAAHKKYPKNLIPFFRLNPNFNWEDEFDRCVSLGFRGIKLHPRSQNFEIGSAEATKIYRRAEEKKLVVLMHLGIGTEEGKIADKLLTITRKFPKLRLILGHGAFVDLDNAIKKLGRTKNVLFDLSTMQIFDLFTLMSHVNEKKLVFGSDIPYYDIGISLEAVIDTALMLNKSPSQIQDMLGNNLLRLFYD